jgi:hypothetical protein
LIIVVYQALGTVLGQTYSAPPEHMRFCASLQPGDRSVPCWTAHGATAEEAHAKIVAFWNRETAKAENIHKRGANLRKAASTSDAPIADSMDDADFIVL